MNRLSSRLSRRSVARTNRLKRETEFRLLDWCFDLGPIFETNDRYPDVETAEQHRVRPDVDLLDDYESALSIRGEKVPSIIAKMASWFGIQRDGDRFAPRIAQAESRKAWDPLPPLPRQDTVPSPYLPYGRVDLVQGSGSFLPPDAALTRARDFTQCFEWAGSSVDCR